MRNVLYQKKALSKSLESRLSNKRSFKFNHLKK